jgi:hypothetical protein
MAGAPISNVEPNREKSPSRFSTGLHGAACSWLARPSFWAGEIERFVADMPQGRREFEVVARHHLEA